MAMLVDASNSIQPASGGIGSARLVVLTLVCTYSSSLESPGKPIETCNTLPPCSMSNERERGSSALEARSRVYGVQPSSWNFLSRATSKSVSDDLLRYDKFENELYSLFEAMGAIFGSQRTS